MLYTFIVVVKNRRQTTAGYERHVIGFIQYISFI